MSFDWKDYIKLSDKLYNEVNKAPIEEAYYRSLVSRGYYGVFCLLRIKADLEFYKPRPHTSDPGVHQKVIAYYKNSNKLEEKEAGNLLDKLRKMRNKADYDRNENIGKDLAERARLKVNHVLRRIFGEKL
ncbi:MAG: DNA-binding protein [archaeon]